MAGPKLILSPRQVQIPTLSFWQFQPAVGLKPAAERTTDRKLPVELIDAVADLIEREDRRQPMSDSELAAAVAQQNEQFGDGGALADIALARRQLQVGAAAERRSDYENKG